MTGGNDIEYFNENEFVCKSCRIRYKLSKVTQKEMIE